MKSGTARWPAIGVHAGLALVAASAAWTVQPEGWFGRGEWLSFALVGLALLLAGGVGLVRGASGWVARASLALGAATALYLAYDPQLAAVPGLGALAMGPVGMLEPSLAHLGVLIAALFLALYHGFGRGALPGRVPFRSAVVTAAGLVLVLAGVMWLSLQGIYDLSGTSGTGMLVFRVVAYSLLMIVCLTLSGAPGVGAAAHLYLGAALLVAIARNLMGMS